MRHPDVLVLGGGIIGLACARELDRRGLSVEVVERGRCGGAASDAAAGLLSPLAEIGDGGPFLDACYAARDQWQDWAAELAAESATDLGYDRSGALVVDTHGCDHPEGGRPKRLARRAAELGEKAELVDRAALEELVPDIAPAIGEAVLLAGEHHVDNRAVCAALVRCLEARNVPLHEGHEAERVAAAGEGIRLDGRGFTRTAARLLVTAGAWSGGLEGLPALPVRPVRGQMFEVAGVEWPWRGSLWEGHCYAVRRAGGRLLVGATVEDAGFASHTTPDGLAALFDFGRVVLPGLGGRPLVSSWAGLRPGTPDGLPVLGRYPGLPAWVAAGHYRYGILLAPWTASVMVDLICGAGGVDPTFSPVRFAGLQPSS